MEGVGQNKTFGARRAAFFRVRKPREPLIGAVRLFAFGCPARA